MLGEEEKKGRLWLSDGVAKEISGEDDDAEAEGEEGERAGTLSGSEPETCSLPRRSDMFLASFTRLVEDGLGEGMGVRCGERGSGNNWSSSSSWIGGEIGSGFMRVEISIVT